MANNYTHKECIEALWKATEQLGGKSPTYSEYRDLDILPSTQVFDNKFGGFNNAKKAAGLTTRKKRNNRVPYHGWTHGYEVIRHCDGDQYHQVAVHRLIAVAEHGIEAVKDNVVHHENGHTRDNRLCNLRPMSRGDHSRMHRLQEAANRAD